MYVPWFNEIFKTFRTSSSEVADSSFLLFKNKAILLERCTWPISFFHRLHCKYATKGVSRVIFSFIIKLKKKVIYFLNDQVLQIPTQPQDTICANLVRLVCLRFYLTYYLIQKVYSLRLRREWKRERANQTEQNTKFSMTRYLEL